MFDIKTPCSNCPFRKETGAMFGLPPSRIVEITTSVAFQCHKTIVYDGEEIDRGDNPQQCAGLMAILLREGKPNQIMKLALFTNFLDPSTIDPNHEAFESIDQAIAAHQSKRS